MFPRASETSEWLLPDGRGCFASGTASGTRTRRYNALLMAAPDGSRVILVNGIEAWVEAGGQRIALTRQRYEPDVLDPAMPLPLVGFTFDPAPRWTFHLPASPDFAGLTLHHEVALADNGATVLSWRADASNAALLAGATLHVRLLMSGRDYHALHHENGAFDFVPHESDGALIWRPYANGPDIRVQTAARYRHEPIWYRHFLYTAERDRGLDCVEDLASPGIFTFDLGAPATLSLRSGPPRSLRRTAAARDILEPSAMAGDYLLQDDAGTGLIAGFPWFTEWGRDTFIAMRGLVIETGRRDSERAILLRWAARLSQGMLPNRITDGGDLEYNTVDATLWFAIRTCEFLRCDGATDADKEILEAAVLDIVAHHKAGTRWRIAVDPTDGLLAAGEPNSQLTWMDARVDGVAITPRVGKPIEIQALWYNVLRLAAMWDESLGTDADRVKSSVQACFVDHAAGGLYDVVDVDHVAGTIDAAIRPNQIFAVGGLPFALLDGGEARAVVALVEAHLVTPFGLRTLSPTDPRYRPHYEGGPAQRDSAYHQGTVWPWLIGAFVDAWLRANGSNPTTRTYAREKFLAPLLAHRFEFGLGHVAEVYDGDAPHRPGGCPYQAWSLGELIYALNLTEREAP